MSGGEKARLSLSKLMLREANMLILDEPTNHLDLFSREVLEAALLDYEGTLLFISHDRYFLNKMAERVIELHPEGMEQFLGNYDDYVAKKLELKEIAMENASSANNSKTATESSPSEADKNGATSYAAGKQAKSEERSRQRKIEAYEQQIAELEETIHALELEMASPEVYQDYEALQAIQSKLEERKQELTEVYSAWEQLLGE